MSQTELRICVDTTAADLTELQIYVDTAAADLTELQIYVDTAAADLTELQIYVDTTAADYLLLCYLSAKGLILLSDKHNCIQQMLYGRFV